MKKKMKRKRKWMEEEVTNEMSARPEMKRQLPAGRCTT